MSVLTAKNCDRLGVYNVSTVPTQDSFAINLKVSQDSTTCGELVICYLLNDYDGSSLEALSTANISALPNPLHSGNDFGLTLKQSVNLTDGDGQLVLSPIRLSPGSYYIQVTSPNPTLASTTSPSIWAVGGGAFNVTYPADNNLSCLLSASSVTSGASVSPSSLLSGSQTMPPTTMNPTTTPTGHSSAQNTAIIAATTVAAVLSVIAVILVIFYRRRRRERHPATESSNIFRISQWIQQVSPRSRVSRAPTQPTNSGWLTAQREPSLHVNAMDDDAFSSVSGRARNSSSEFAGLGYAPVERNPFINGSASGDGTMEDSGTFVSVSASTRAPS